ncbi:MAG: GtrA family protein [Prolixibacteraceae bacterium]|nr:GtrA family protein [Prolixibacteraceae bacterium]
MIKIARQIRILILKLIDLFYFPFLRFIPVETFRYGATGGMNTAFDIFLYFVFYNFVLDKKILDLGFVSISPHIAAFLFVFPITFSTGFLLAKYITFTQSMLRGRIQLFRYGVSVGGSILLNYFLLKFFVEIVGLWATSSKIITTFIVIVYSYIIQKHFSFRTGKKALQKDASKIK